MKNITLSLTIIASAFFVACVSIGQTSTSFFTKKDFKGAWPDRFPYEAVKAEYEMLKESTYPYTNIERINEEKIRILKHLDAIKADCDALAMDVEKSLRLKDTIETDSIVDFSMNEEEDE